MSTRQEGAPSPYVRSRADLVAWIAEGEKPPADWRIGTEHEKFVFHTGALTPTESKIEVGSPVCIRFWAIK